MCPPTTLTQLQPEFDMYFCNYFDDPVISGCKEFGNFDDDFTSGIFQQVLNTRAQLMAAQVCPAIHDISNFVSDDLGQRFPEC
jgi:hypothetical protein